MSDELIAWLRIQLDTDQQVANDPGVMDFGEFIESRNRAHVEVDAKRRIIEAEQDRVLEEGPLPERMRDLIETDVIKLLALPYAERPGYREEWKP